MPDIEHKTFEIKALTDEGQVEAMISTFGMDRDGDVMTSDAFKGSQGKAIPMVWSHNWDMPIGKGIVTVEKDGAKLAGQFFMDTQDGLEAYKRVKAMGSLQEYSIGFRVKEADFGYQEDDAGSRVYVRTIKDLELFEASPVLVGAAYNTGTLAIKDARKPENAIKTALESLKSAEPEAIPPNDDSVDQLVSVIEEAASRLEGLLDGDGEEAEKTADKARNRLKTALAALLKGAKAPEPPISAIETERKLKDLEAALGYRPLIADKVY